jgi:hypothetical protein
MIKKLRSDEEFLCYVLTHKDYLYCEKIKSLFEELGSNNLFKLCQHNKIESIAADSLIRCIGVDKIPGYWIEAHKDMNLRINSYMKELDNVSKILTDNNVEIVALKNSGITRGLYEEYAASPMGDLDVLVRKRDFRKAHKILIDFGYEMKFRSPLEELNIEKAEQGGGAEYSVKLANGDSLWFELQWRPIAGRWIRPDQEPSSDELMDNSICVKGSSAKLLSPVDNLIQVCLHSAKHTYVRAPGFRLFTDTDRIIRECKLDWDEFVHKVTLLEVKSAIFFSLQLSADLLKTPVPEEVLINLKPSRWKVFMIFSWLYRVGLFDPDGKKWSKIGYIVFVSFLYDSFGGFIRSVFPESTWMKQKYDFTNSLLLPYFHIYRLINLVSKRTLNK